MLQVLLSQDVQLLLYFIHGLVSGVSHGLGLGLRFSHIVELWVWCLQGPSLSLGSCYCPGCMVIPLGVTIISQRLMFYLLSCNNILGFD